MLNVILNIFLIVVQNLPDCKMQMLVTASAKNIPYVKNCTWVLKDTGHYW